MTTTIQPGHWGDTPVSPKRSGLWIERDHRRLFIPDESLLGLANDIADHLAGARSETAA
ncbi:hypothetical protein ACTXPS_19895 [Brachybacterium tyrofermentans]|uniref:hypothetical protein n=1 Tax=Brachybacterium tyrofermentans TaxID=47848 RepID=UPI003FD0669E